MHPRDHGSAVPSGRAGKRYLGRLELLQSFAVLRNVEPLELLLQRNPQRDKETDQFEEQMGGNGRPAQGDGNAVKLCEQQMRIALEKAGSPANGGSRKNSSQQNAGHSTDTVNAKDIERIVISQSVFEPGTGPETHKPGDDADQDTLPGHDESGCRRNRSETRNGA